MAGTFTALLFHVVFSTKDRQPLISEIWSDDLYAYMGGIARSEGGSLRCAGGIEDHVHLLLECKASMPLSTVVGRIKAQSSKWVNENGKAKMVEVKTGISDYDNIEITSGLTTSSEVVTGPFLVVSKRLKDGDAIRQAKKKKEEKKD